MKLLVRRDADGIVGERSGDSCPVLSVHRCDVCGRCRFESSYLAWRQSRHPPDSFKRRVRLRSAASGADAVSLVVHPHIPRNAERG